MIDSKVLSPDTKILSELKMVYDEFVKMIDFCVGHPDFSEKYTKFKSMVEEGMAIITEIEATMHEKIEEERKILGASR